MAKNLYINKEQLEGVIGTSCTLKMVESINPDQGFYRYHLEKEGIAFSLNVYYTKKRGTTVVTGCKNGQELEQTIINSIEYKEVRNGSFSANMSEKNFNSLVEFLKQLPSVVVSSPEEKGDNGTIYRIRTNFGDSVTLTYFKTTSRMLYQGLLMKLYSIIKSYLLTFDNQISKTEFGEQALEDRIQTHVKTYFPESWDNLEPTVQGFIKDSFTLVEVDTKLSDYAAWVMPVMRILEYRIKKVCLDYGVIIDDTKGFRYYTNPSNPKATDWVFIKDSSTDTVIDVNPNMPQNAKDIIIECYEFLRHNRHEMFHATQILSSIKLVETKDQALQLIIETCEKIEKSTMHVLVD